MTERIAVEAPSSESPWVLRRCGGTECQPGTCNHDGEEPLRRSAVGAGPAYAPPIVHDVVAAQGDPLDESARADMEQRFGRDFSGVRLHTGPLAAASAAAVYARAYTVGQHVVFGAGQYAPSTAIGRHVLAHELMHTLQMRNIGSQVGDRIQIGDPGHHTENEAERAATSGGMGPATDSGDVLRRQLLTPLGPRLPDDACPGVQVDWPKKNLVWYEGGNSGCLVVVKRGREIHRTRAVSGFQRPPPAGPGIAPAAWTPPGEWEKDSGPIPITPRETPNVYHIQPRNLKHSNARDQGDDNPATWAGGMDGGYQRITNPRARRVWGPERFHIVIRGPGGQIAVPAPDGSTVMRGEFFLHSGTGQQTSGCIKVEDGDQVFDRIRSLVSDAEDEVRVCVGGARSCGGRPKPPPGPGPRP